MKLYIQTQGGQPINNPAFEDNLMQAFGSIPKTWEPFIRVERPTWDVYQVLESATPVYAKVDGVWSDVWSVRDMTAEEKEAKQQATRDAFSSREYAENWSAWVLDEVICEMVPPIPRPEPDQAKLSAGIHTYWCGADNNWKDTPVYPTDGTLYKFDFFAWQWVVLVN